MDINDYLANLQADINNQLSGLGLNNETGSEQKPSEVSEPTDTSESTGSIFCPECGTEMPADSNFCPNCGCKMEEYQSDDEPYDEDDDSDDAPESQLILVYRASRLADKYDIETDDVVDTMEEIQQLLEENNVDVSICDLDDYIDSSFDNWEGLSDAIRQFIREELDVPMGPSLSVMLIGGDDCIQMPRIDNPTESGLSQLHSDLLYCWEEPPICLDDDADDKVYLDYSSADFNISRLPLEEGDLESDFEDDIKSYFNKVLEVRNGIVLKNIVMTSTASWIPASTAMVDKLPLINMRNVPEDAKRNGMYISPSVSIENDDVLGVYEDSLQNADMLLFNLHGSDEEGSSCYFGQEGWDYPEAISTDLMAETSARIVNTVACFGARFVGYSRDDSMLLTAMHRSESVVMFVGSCSTAFGRSGCAEFENMMAPTAFSETFMKLYVLYQLKGMPAGQAFLKAKCDYLNYFIKSEDHAECVGTILMFNLFGMPTLFVKPRKDVIERVNGNKEAMIGKGTPKAMRIKLERPQKKLIMHKDAHPSGGGLLAELRDAVDANLAAIRSVIEENVYRQFGLSGHDLQSIESFSEKRNGKVTKGYYFNYDQSSAHVRTQTFVKVDENGRLIDAIHTK